MKKLADDISFVEFRGAAALPMAGVVHSLYEEIFGAPPHEVTQEEIVEQRRFFQDSIEYASFSLILARVSGSDIGFGYGCLLPAASRWWSEIEPPIREDSHELREATVFVLVDIGVMAEWRRQGIGRR